MFTITITFAHVFLNAWYAMRMFTRVRSVIISPIAKSGNCLTYILFSTFVTSKEINQAFLHAVKFMINFVSFSCNRTDKTIRLKKTIGERCFSSSFIYNRYKLSWIIFRVVLSRVWYVTTNGKPFSTFVQCKTLWPENLTLLVSVSMRFCGYPLCENHDFISQICFSKSFFLSKFDLVFRMLWVIRSIVKILMPVSWFDIQISRNFIIRQIHVKI